MNATVLKKLSLKAASNFDSDKTEAEASSRWIKTSGKIPAGASKLEVVSPTMNWKTTNYIFLPKPTLSSTYIFWCHSPLGCGFTW